MKTYVEDFLERNEHKSFIANLKKYDNLLYLQKMKVVSSFLTHLIIDQENGIDNTNIIEEVLSILHEMIMYRTDHFMNFLVNNISQ
jgi:hypothetical protein